MTVSNLNLGAAFVSAILVLSLPLATRSAYANSGGDCHFHGSTPASEETVLACATSRKEKLISKGKIDAIWKDLKHEKIEAIAGKKGKEWKVTFKDPAAKDKSKEALFLYFTQSGNFIAANHTGR